MGLPLRKFTKTEIQELQANFEYEPETGLIRWLTASNDTRGRTHHSIGDICGVNTGPKKSKKGVPYTQYLQVCFTSSKNVHRYIKLHRLAYLLTKGKDIPKNLVIDHIDGNKQNNTWVNLRIVSPSKNNFNRKNGGLSKHSGVIGVIYDEKTAHWYANITRKYKTEIIGKYAEFDDAVKARRKAELKYYKETLIPEDYMNHTHYKKQFTPEEITTNLELMTKMMDIANQLVTNYRATFGVGHIKTREMQRLQKKVGSKFEVVERG